MKIATIICEFNPIHTGHKRLIDYAKTIADKVVCIMSGNFVQRGMPACADKYDRARHAILCGADMVIELPTIYATAPATDFAYGGVKIASQIGADYLVFGSECGNIQELQKIALLLDDEQINKAIATNVAQGYSYPKAVSLAVNSPILQSPNNTLAIEYLRAIKTIGANITPITIKREDNYNGNGTQFASSSALRKDASLRDKFTYDFVLPDINDKVEHEFCNFVCHHLATLDASNLVNIFGIGEGIENRIASCDKHLGYEIMMEQIKTKRYTRARLQRILLNCVLGITSDNIAEQKSKEIATKVLAIKASATTLLQRCNQIEEDKFTKLADNLYLSFSGKKAPTKLQKVD